MQEWRSLVMATKPSTKANSGTNQRTTQMPADESKELAEAVERLTEVAHIIEICGTADATKIWGRRLSAPDIRLILSALKSTPESMGNADGG
jgi:hypothetical protein